MHTTKLAAAISAMTAREIPGGVSAAARRLLLDTIGCIVASRATEIAPLAQALAGSLGVEAGGAYAHARLADCMDFNEGYGGAHFGCGAVAVVLALAAHRRISGSIALAAIVAGYETGARITEAIGSYYVTDAVGRTSFAPVWGIATQVTFAAAAAACRALRLDAGETARALDIAGSNSPLPIGGKWSASVELPNTKYCDAGWCAVAGLFAAVSAAAGSTAVADLLDAPYDIYGMLGAPNANPAAATVELGQSWHLPLARYKEWSCCGLISGPIAVLRDCVEAAGIGVRTIERIVVEVDPAIALERFASTDPRTFVSRQFSLPHAATMLLLDIPTGAAWLSRAVADHPAVRALRARFTVRGLDEASAPAGRRGLCAVHVTAGGRTYSTAPATAAPSVSFGDAEALAKFRRLVEPDQGEAIIASVMALEGLADLQTLTGAIAAARPRGDLASVLARLDACATLGMPA